MHKTLGLRTTFGNWDVENEKVHAVVARKILRSQKCKILTVSDHSGKLRWWKSARRCGAKNICKSQCTKHTIPGALLEIEMLKKRTLLWREAHFQVEMLKHHMFGPPGRSHVASRSRRKGLCTLSKVSKTCFPSITENKAAKHGSALGLIKLSAFHLHLRPRNTVALWSVLIQASRWL